MSTFAAVVTGKGTGAISTIQLFGDKAEETIRKIFKPAGTKFQALEPGKICLGTISSGSEIIDQVTIGCEAADSFAINCHGNPIIAADIMKLLERCGVKLLSPEQLRAKILSAQKTLNTIAIEARLALPGAMTLEGTKIIANQIEAGLNRTARKWLDNINKISLNKIKAEAAQILQASQKAKLIVNGCIVCLVGPPNTGKSTLLNWLAGRDKAIVTDIKGTTRDWVSGQCRIGPLYVELVDTAGLDEAPSGDIEKQSQQKAVEMLRKADLILLVLDNSTMLEQPDQKLLDKIAGKPVLTVLNKSDLPVEFDPTKLPPTLANTVAISAKLGIGLEELAAKVRQALGVVDFDLKQPVCITSRQLDLLEKLAAIKSNRQAAEVITELLNGRVCV